MGKYQKKTVVKPFHLDTEEYQKMFGHLRAYDQSVIAVGLNPIKTSGIVINSKEVDKAEQIKLAQKGLRVISIGAAVKTELKIGDLVCIATTEAIDYAENKQIIVKDVFPGLRKYTCLVFRAHNIIHIVEDKQELEEYETQVDIDTVLDEENEYRKKRDAKKN